MVYVLNIHGKPLMPCTEAKARKLLKSNKAKPIKRTPFTIQLAFECDDKTQDISLGVDAGSRTIGLSATTGKKELYAAEVTLRNDIVKLIAARREMRRTRRSRLRYRQARFNNRKASKKPGWLAPSVRQKVGSHLKVIEDVYKILPITSLTVEVASFDIQKIKDPGISGKDYQEGDQLGFWNTREYVLFRDGHVCQCCKGKSKDPVLNVHHIESRQTGGDAPNNLVTLCETCHKGYHKGLISLPKKIRRGMSFHDAAFMGIMRWAVYNELKKRYSNVHMTYGYLTKNARIRNNLEKTHAVDARCISGNPAAEPLPYVYLMRKIRCHNRQIHKAKILKGGKKKRNQTDYVMHGYRLFDKVKYEDQECFVFARRKSGYFNIRLLDGTIIHTDTPNSTSPPTSTAHSTADTPPTSSVAHSATA